MKHLKNVMVIALIVLTTSLATFAQQISDKARRADDPRNIAPTIGTGGAVGGPTGLFTVYDGQTLRAGEYTFSIGFSNFDRDPGNVDITETPISFQIGLNNYLEAFFSTDAYRQIKVNSPRNLSSFSLPNSQVRINGVLTSAPAFVLAPTGLAGVATNAAVFRPQGVQPFVQFPFVGGSGGVARNGNVGTSFGTLGPVRAGGGSDSDFFPSADLFPGIGSIYGSILPGVVLQTTAAAVAGGQVPTVGTTQPSYLPDAPFINRTYGESAFSTFNAGVKWRFTRPNSPIGIGVIPFIRFYADKANDFSGFNQLQRGASPGGDRFEGGFVFFGDARLARYANLSANAGYTFNAPVRGNFANGDFVLLDRGDEVNAGVALDFPVNRYFQPIVEARGTKYVGGRTPNAFEQDPLDALAGIRIFPTRFIALTAAYRYNINQQDADSFDDDDTFATTTTLNGVTTTRNITGVPGGFVTSNDPHGFMFGAAIGRRNAREVPTKPNTPAVINNVTLSDSEVVLPVCAQPGFVPRQGAQCNDSTSINVAVSASDVDNDPIVYQYTVSGGRINGTGANVTWDVSGLQPGTYSLSVGADDGCGVCGTPVSREVRLVPCPDCVNPAPPCPTDLAVTANPTLVNPGETVTFTATFNPNGTNPTFNWTASEGTIESGQGTPSITVRVPQGAFGRSITGTATLGNIDPTCNNSASATVQTASEAPRADLVDEFGRLANDDIKARADNAVVRQQGSPGSRIFVISYGSAREVTRRNNFIVTYLTRNRGVDPASIVTVNGGTEATIRTQLYVVPTGAAEPTPAPQQ